MTLDVYTALVIGAGFIAVTAVALVLLARALPSELRRSAFTGSVAAAVMSFSWMLFAFGDRLPDVVTVLGSNLLYLLAVTVLYQSVRIFDGVRPRRDIYLIVAPVAVLLVVFRYAFDIYAVRVMVESVAVAVVLSLCGRRLLTPTTKSQGAVGRQAAAYWFFANALVMVFRPFTALALSSTSAVLGNEPLNVLMVVAGIITVLGAVFSYFLLFAGRVTAELERQAQIDPLTGLFNRRAFEKLASEALERAARDESSLSLLILDADRFKLINDTWGHKAGDDALRALADGLQENLRPHDIVARLGGDEFAVVMPGLNGTVVEELRPRLRAILEAQPFDHPGVLQVSIGAASRADGADDLHALLKRADRDLYRQKKARAGRTGAPTAAGLRRRTKAES